MIIVTGGAGFIGSGLVWELNRRGEEDILVVDELGKGEKWKNLRALRFKDYIEKNDFYRRLEGGSWKDVPAAIAHLGACSSTTEEDASYLVDNNFKCSKLLARYAMEKGVRFVYASSAATYGDGSQGYKDEEATLRQLRPLNMYGYSKQMFDLWANEHGVLDSAVGLKYFNIYGPNEYHKGEMRSKVVKAYEEILQTGHIHLFRSYRDDYKDGEQKRDFLYVKDAVRITAYFLESRDKSGIYNVGSGVARTWVDLARAVFAAMGREVSVKFIDMPENIREKYQYFTEAPLEKLRSAGYCDPVMPLEEAVRDYVQGYLAKKTYLQP